MLSIKCDYDNLSTYERVVVDDVFSFKCYNLRGYTMVNRKLLFNVGYVFTISQASNYPPVSAPQFITIKK